MKTYRYLRGLFQASFSLCFNAGLLGGYLAAADKQRLLLQAKSTTEHQEATEKSEQSKKGFFHKIFGK